MYINAYNEARVYKVTPFLKINQHIIVLVILRQGWNRENGSGATKYGEHRTWERTVVEWVGPGSSVASATRQLQGMEPVFTSLDSVSSPLNCGWLPSGVKEVPATPSELATCSPLRPLWLSCGLRNLSFGFKYLGRSYTKLVWASVSSSVKWE